MNKITILNEEIKVVRLDAERAKGDLKRSVEELSELKSK